MARGKAALKLLGAKRFVSFVEAVRSSHDCFAVQLAAAHINRGEPVEALFSKDSRFSFTASALDTDRFLISFGCHPGPHVGDGGEWEISFGPDGTVLSVLPGPYWIS